jgi:hypothetical protein
MSRLRAYLVLVTGAFSLASPLFFARAAYAGPERITVSCGTTSEYDSQTNTVVVPITVTMNSNGPDYIDMTYTANDNAGNPVSCDPSSNRLYVAKNAPGTDSVSVTYSGTNTPVSFNAYGQGEVNGYDSDGCQLYLYYSAPLPGTPLTPHAPASGTSTVVAGNAHPVSNYIVPMTIKLSSGGDRITLNYSATDTNNATNYVPCMPASESVIVTGTGAGVSVTHNVAIKYMDQPTTASLSFKVIAAGLTGANGVNPANAGSFSMAFPTTASTNSTTGLLTLSCAPTLSTKEYMVPVNITPVSGDLLVIRYTAVDVNNQELHCRLQRTTSAAVRTDYILVNCDKATGLVTFTAHVHSNMATVADSTTTFTP